MIDPLYKCILTLLRHDLIYIPFLHTKGVMKGPEELDL